MIDFCIHRVHERRKSNVTTLKISASLVSRRMEKYPWTKHPLPSSDLKARSAPAYERKDGSQTQLDLALA